MENIVAKESQGGLGQEGKTQKQEDDEAQTGFVAWRRASPMKFFGISPAPIVNDVDRAGENGDHCGRANLLFEFDMEERILNCRQSVFVGEKHFVGKLTR